jgi:Ca2+/Na+ antiporter
MVASPQDRGESRGAGPHELLGCSVTGKYTVQSSARPCLSAWTCTHSDLRYVTGAGIRLLASAAQPMIAPRASDFVTLTLHHLIHTNNPTGDIDQGISMANAAVIAYNAASFVCALFVLEFGADKFIDHTAIVAERTGIPESIIGLLTAGAEWEELAVVVICILRSQSSLAVGNIIGSGISNILGAFSLGLILRSHEEVIVFDSSARIYTLVMLLVTGIVVGLQAVDSPFATRLCGGILIAIFVFYIGSVAYLIFKGRLTAPESDSDSDSDSDSESESDDGSAHNETMNNTDATTPLLATERPLSRPRHEHGIAYHVAILLLGFSAILLSSFVLSNASSSIAEESGMSEVLFGVVFLSIATTLPEKFIAVMSGSRNRTGILVANTVGSNIFLLTLCLGILWISTAGNFDRGTVQPVELAVLLGSSLFMTLVVWFGARWSRLAGVIMLVAYIAFLVLEFAVVMHT